MDPAPRPPCDYQQRGLTIHLGGRERVVSVRVAPAALQAATWPARALQRADNLAAVDVPQRRVQALDCREKAVSESGSLWEHSLPQAPSGRAALREPASDPEHAHAAPRCGYSPLMLLPSRLTQRLSKAMLCSSRELGFSTRILLMSSTPNCSSRASSGGETRSQHRALQHPPSSPEPKRPGMLCGAQPEAVQSSPPSPSEHGRTGGRGSWDGLGLRPLCTGHSSSVSR